MAGQLNIKQSYIQGPPGMYKVRNYCESLQFSTPNLKLTNGEKERGGGETTHLVTFCPFNSHLSHPYCN